MSDGRGKTKSRHARGGKATRSGDGKTSIFFADETTAGTVSSFSFATLIDLHMAQGCAPSNVFSKPDPNDPSACA